MGIFSSGCAAVDAMERVRITGNVTPARWYKEILRGNGKPDLLAVTLLSDIVYWYRPVEVRDEFTGSVTGIRKKFKGDLLQKTYDQYAAQFGESKRTIKAALDRLEELGLIKKVFRDIFLKTGVKVPNVMYIAIDPERIESISHEEIDMETFGPTVQKPGEEVPGIYANGQDEAMQTAQDEGSAGGGTKFCTTSHKKMYDPLQDFVPRPTENRTHVLQDDAGRPTADCGTYTENTKGITTENILEITMGDPRPVPSVNNGDAAPDRKEDRRTDRERYISLLKEQVYYDRLCDDDLFRCRMDTVDGIINIIADIASTEPPDGYERVNGRNYPHEVVKGRLLKLDYELLSHVLGRLNENCTNIRNLRAYLITALYNAKDEMDLSVQAQVNHDMYGGGWEEKGII